LNLESYIFVNLVSSKGEEKEKSMKAFHSLYGKKLLSLPILLLLALGLLGVLNVNVTKVSAVEYPGIMVVPESIVDSTLIIGENFTVSIYTNYDPPMFPDITGYQFDLSYNPNVLNGVEVTNGDIIVGGSANFIPGPFNNTAGELSRTVGLFLEKEVADGPGTLAYVTFTVVGKGNSSITIGPKVKLKGYNIFTETVFDIISFENTDTWNGDGVTTVYYANKTPVVPDSEYVYVNETDMTKPENYTIVYDTGEITFTTAPGDGAEIGVNYLYFDYDHLQHGYFDNRFMDDVAVGSVTTQDEAAVGDLVPISVEVTNKGIFNEEANVTIRYDTTYIDSQNVTLLVGESETVLFSWNTAGVLGDTYTINATATIPGDEDLTDNWNTTTIHIVAHDVAVGSVTAPDKAASGESVPISVEVTNEGAFNEVANVTIRYGTTYIDSQNVTLATGTNTTASLNWNTTGVTEGTYTVNATATIPRDDDLTDNWNAATIHIVEHDVAIISLDAPAEAVVGDPVFINVTIANIGSSDENVTLTVSCVYEHPIEPPPTVLDTRNFTLAPGTNTTASFNWNTTGLDALYPYTVNATATIPLDDDPTDNIKTTQITLTSHDIEVLTLTPSPYSVFVGEPINIEVNVKNVGDHNETFNVKVSYDTTIITEFQQIKLIPENSTILSYNWNTTDIASGSYKMKAEAVLTNDAKPDNNLKTRDVFINLPLGTIAGTITNASNGLPIEGASVTTDNYTNTTNADGHYTITDVLAGTYTVTASATGYESSPQTDITVTAGETTTLNFTLTPLPTTGTITGIVTDSSTGEPIANAILTVNDMSTTTNSSGAYVISNVLAGTYTVTASANGYEDSSQTDITVVAGQTTTVDFELTPSEPAQPLNIILYAGVAAVAIIIIAGIAIYILKVRKPT